MTFSIKAIIRAFVAPNHRIRCGQPLWDATLAELHRRGARRHEAGVFLLGRDIDGKRVVEDVVFYDTLDPRAYASGVCVLHAPAFAKLWEICRARQLSVVADIHTHPGGSAQSWEDRTNPMVARPGHVAIIIPRFAVPPTSMQEIGVYEYRGDHAWVDQSPRRATGFFYVGLWS